MQGFRDSAIIAFLVWFTLFTPLVAAKEGEIVFTSNRDKGNKRVWAFDKPIWEIYVMDANGQNIKRLTNNELIEYQPAWSPDGTKIAFAGTTEVGRVHPDIFVMDADGKNRINLTQSPFASEFAPTWSPDGKRIAFVSEGKDGNLDIYVMDADGKNIIRLTRNPGMDRMPDWSPDGACIAYVSRPNKWDANDEIYIMRPDGTNKKKLTNRPTNMDIEPTWSPDSRKLAFISMDLIGGNLYDIFVMDADGKRVTNLTQAPGYYYSLSWSPDGKQLVFSSSRDEDTGIYVMDDVGQNIQRLTGGAIDWYVDWSKFGFSVRPLNLLKMSWGAIKNMEVEPYRHTD